MSRPHIVAIWLLALTTHVFLAAQSSPPGLEGTAWNAVELAGTVLPAEAIATADRRPHLVFGAGGRLSGADGCNRLTGPYDTAVQPNGITFGNLAGTRMACPNTDDIAKRFHDALAGTSHWSIVRERLEFYGATGKPLAVFERRPPTPQKP